MGVELAYTDAVARATEGLYAKVANFIPRAEWVAYAPAIAEINRLKREKNAVILAHNYMTPEIFHGVGDFMGDSLALAREAARTDAKVIVQAGVHFMAETSKILSPEKTVLIPSMKAGCSLASSITGADVRLLKQKYPGLPVVTYVNTSADVKAESDICCTSGNAVKVVEAIARDFGTDTVIMIPDKFLARNVAAKTGVKVITWEGACEVHERFTAQEIRDYRAAHPGITVLAHPECPPEVVAEADFAGSTAAMINYVGDNKPRRVVMITECSMSDNVAVEHPDVEFVRPCNLCPHMKRITLTAFSVRFRP
jgi:quinolinate synthase